MQILIPLGFNPGIFLLLHFLIGKYQIPLPHSKNPRREIFEALGLWLILAIAVTVAVFVVPKSELTNPSFQTVLLTNLVLSPFWILIPLILFVRGNQWRSNVLSLALEVRSLTGGSIFWSSPSCLILGNGSCVR